MHQGQVQGLLSCSISSGTEDSEIIRMMSYHLAWVCLGHCFGWHPKALPKHLLRCKGFRLSPTAAPPSASQMPPYYRETIWNNVDCICTWARETAQSQELLDGRVLILLCVFIALSNVPSASHVFSCIHLYHKLFR